MSDRDPAAPSRRELAVLAGSIALGLVVRVLWLRDASTLPFFSLPQTDDYVYAHGAARIAAGDLWLDGQPLRFGPPYFYVLALVDAIAGDGPFAPRVLQIALGLGVIPCVWWTARSITGSSVAGLAATFIAALYAPAIFFEALLLPETAMTLTHALLGVATVRAVRGTAARPWLAVGALAGLAVAFRPNALFLVVPLVAFASRRIVSDLTARARRDRGLTLGLGLGLGLAPLALRNVVALGTPLSASTAGINAYIGNGPGATGVFRVPPDVPGAASPAAQFMAFRDAASSALGHAATDAEADRFWLARTLDHAAAHPLDVLAVLARKTQLFWNARELSNLVDQEFLGSLGNTLSLPLVRFGWIAPLGLAGMVLMLSPRRAPAERALAWLTLAGSLSVILVFVQDRYRVPFVPWLIVCAVAAAKIASDLARAKRWRELGIATVPVLLGLVLAFPPIAVRAHPERQWTELGAGYRELGRDGDACAAFRHALDAAPDFAPAREGTTATCE